MSWLLFRAVKTMISFQGVPSKLPAQLVCFVEIILVCPLVEKVSVYEFSKHVLMCGTCSFYSDTKKPGVVLDLVQCRVALSLMDGLNCSLQLQQECECL